jgi:hypothetical protein
VIEIVVSPISITLLILILMLVLLSSRARTDGPMFAARWFTGVFFVAGILYAFSESADVATDPIAADGGSAIQVVLGLGLVAATATRRTSRSPSAAESLSLEWKQRQPRVSLPSRCLASRRQPRC